MKSLNIILVALIAIVVTGFIFVISIADLQAPTTDYIVQNTDDAVVVDDSDTNLDYSLFENQELGIRFEYPAEWGELEVSIKDTTPEIDIENPTGDWRKETLISIPERGIIMSSYTKGENLGRGGYWADYVERTKDETTLNLLCYSLEDPSFAVQPAESCADFTNLAGINFIQLNGSVDWWGELTNYVDLYLAHHPNHEYYGVAFSTVDLAENGEVSKDVADQMYRVIMSLEFID